MATVLVAFASRHGATDELAHAIGHELSHTGLSVDVRPMEDVKALDEYSAFVLGSAVYMGSWMPAAREFVERNQEAIAERPTWLFSSGPIGDFPPDDKNGFDASSLVAATHARDHHLFGGKLDRRSLGLHERMISRLVGAPSGDYRDWAIVAAWATAISCALSAGHVA